MCTVSLTPCDTSRRCRRVLWWNFRVLVTARAAELRTSWKRFACRFSKGELQWPILEWIRKVGMVQAVVWSIILRIRLRSRLLRKRDLEIAEIFCANDGFLSKMTPRLWADSTGESMTLLGRWMVGSNLESCCGRPEMINSILGGLRDRKLDDIQLDTLVIVFSRRVMLWEISRAENDKRNWVSSAKSWLFAEELDMTVLRGVVYKMKSRWPSTDPWGTPWRSWNADDLEYSILIYKERV